ncbi:hypothetical protein Bbelb_307810, partial [Branchiostoma belcheri]
MAAGRRLATDSSLLLGSCYGGYGKERGAAPGGEEQGGGGRRARAPGGAAWSRGHTAYKGPGLARDLPALNLDGPKNETNDKEEYELVKVYKMPPRTQERRQNPCRNVARCDTGQCDLTHGFTGQRYLYNSVTTGVNGRFQDTERDTQESCPTDSIEAKFLRSFPFNLESTRRRLILFFLDPNSVGHARVGRTDPLVVKRLVRLSQIPHLSSLRQPKNLLLERTPISLHGEKPSQPSSHGSRHKAAPFSPVPRTAPYNRLGYSCDFPPGLLNAGGRTRGIKTGLVQGTYLVGTRGTGEPDRAGMVGTRRGRLSASTARLQSVSLTRLPKPPPGFGRRLERVEIGQIERDNIPGELRCEWGSINAGINAIHVVMSPDHLKWGFRGGLPLGTGEGFSRYLQQNRAPNATRDLLGSRALHHRTVHANPSVLQRVPPRAISHLLSVLFTSAYRIFREQKPASPGRVFQLSPRSVHYKPGETQGNQLKAETAYKACQRIKYKSTNNHLADSRYTCTRDFYEVASLERAGQDDRAGNVTSGARVGVWYRRAAFPPRT